MVSRCDRLPDWQAALYLMPLLLLPGGQEVPPDTQVGLHSLLYVLYEGMNLHCCPKKIIIINTPQLLPKGLWCIHSEDRSLLWRWCCDEVLLQKVLAAGHDRHRQLDLVWVQLGPWVEGAALHEGDVTNHFIGICLRKSQ